MDGNGETTFFYVQIWNYPIKTTNKTWFFRVPVPRIYTCIYIYIYYVYRYYVQHIRTRQLASFRFPAPGLWEYNILDEPVTEFTNLEFRTVQEILQELWMYSKCFRYGRNNLQTFKTQKQLRYQSLGHNLMPLTNLLKRFAGTQSATLKIL